VLFRVGPLALPTRPNEVWSKDFVMDRLDEFLAERHRKGQTDISKPHDCHDTHASPKIPSRPGSGASENRYGFNSCSYSLREGLSDHAAEVDASERALAVSSESSRLRSCARGSWISAA
jgi:hypothetical protein